MSIQVSSGSVLSSLYKNQRGETSYYTGSYSKKRVVENESVTKALSNDSDFQKALKKLKYSDYSTGLRSQIKKSAKALVKGFNEFQESKGDGSKQYAKFVSGMKDVFKEYASELSRAGITFDADKLKFDSEKFDDASNETLEKVFGADSRLITTAEKILKNADRTIRNNQFTEVKEDAFISNNINKNNIVYAGHTNSLAVLTDKLNATILDESNDEAVAQMINAYTDEMVKFYNELSDQDKWKDVEISSQASQSLQEMIQLNQDYIDAIDRSSKGENFEYDKWFSQNEDSYGMKVNGLYKDLFAEFVNASRKDFEISSFVDYSI